MHWFKLSSQAPNANIQALYTTAPRSLSTSELGRSPAPMSTPNFTTERTLSCFARSLSSKVTPTSPPHTPNLSILPVVAQSNGVWSIPYHPEAALKSTPEHPEEACGWGAMSAGCSLCFLSHLHSGCLGSLPLPHSWQLVSEAWQSLRARSSRRQPRSVWWGWEPIGGCCRREGT